MIDTELLHALADDELSADDRRKVEADLAQDPEAAKVLSSILAVKQAIASHVKPVECEDEWQRCRKRLDEMDKARRTEAFVGRYAWVMCTGLFAFIVGAILERTADTATEPPLETAHPSVQPTIVVYVPQPVPIAPATRPVP